jgi:hypothetical protein
LLARSIDVQSINRTKHDITEPKAGKKTIAA